MEMGVWLRFFDFSGDEKGNKPEGIDGMLMEYIHKME